MHAWLQHALDSADLMQGYVDLVCLRLDELSQDQKDELGCEIQRTDANGPEEAAALAVIAYLLEGELTGH